MYAYGIIYGLMNGKYECIFMYWHMQRTIAALKLKNSVERETLNDMHMKAIKVCCYENMSFIICYTFTLFLMVTPNYVYYK